MISLLKSIIVRALGVALLCAGCATVRPIVEVPQEEELVREQLVIHTDFPLASRHRLIDDVVALRQRVSETLDLPISDEPIHVYLFATENEYRSFVEARFPFLPERRAWFVETDTKLSIFAHWGDRVAQDLRHEISHGYLHSVVPHLPLWLDEGMAEFFETPRGLDGVHLQHLDLLAQQHNSGQWSPDLSRLETLATPSELSQLDYAESWAWVHFLLHSDAENKALLQNYLARLRMAGSAAPLSTFISETLESPNKQLLAHLRGLAKEK
ncbi:MAG: DUF1570 domain-containing protein [Pirellulaceae bacterium]|nr:DUF1570 domain-containing protein [Pirellulaceae bacterium]MDP7015952.1 DUF1570 domain-containing protein [Pirellulaceae bacterium]